MEVKRNKKFTELVWSKEPSWMTWNLSNVLHAKQERGLFRWNKHEQKGPGMSKYKVIKQTELSWRNTGDSDLYCTLPNQHQHFKTEFSLFVL